MAVISNTLLETLVDRAAKQGEHIESGLTAASLEGTGYFYYKVHSGVGLAGDSDVEEDLIESAADLDEDFTVANSLRLIMSDFINALDTHVRNMGAQGLNAYLTTSGVNVHDYFAEEFDAVKGQDLDAINVFCPEELTLGTVCITGSGEGAWTDGDVVGTGTGSWSSTNHAAARLVVELQANGSGEGICSGVELQLCLTKEDLTSELKTISITSGTGPLVRTDVGTHPTDEYIDVTSAIWAGGCSGTCLKILNEIERTIVL